MERHRLKERLVAAERNAEEEGTRIKDKKASIASLRARGANTNKAEQQLLAFERAQDNHLAEIEHLEDALRNISPQL